MRTFIRGSLFLIVAGLMSGCASNTGSTAAMPVAAQADKVADTKACVMQTGGVNDLRLTISADTKYSGKDGSLHITAPQFEVEVWRVRAAQTVDDAIGHIGEQIVSEFKDFKATHTTDLTIAGSTAKRLVGPGHEADDGDPGEADLIVFKVGDHVFIACTHGESLAPIARQGLLTLVQTAQMP